ncbi:MAG TPA: hypothetical protein VFJ74_07050 [Gemmatimonadaceae bacterium]|nr:hypothetical protein [Gemmatimonadaceae bacterium]
MTSSDLRVELRALCVGRHEYLSDHLGRFFGRFGLETTCAVGIDGAAVAARAARPDVVICDYDLLATMSLDSWEQDELLSRTPVVAVSMTRLPDELHPLDVNGIGGFLYLPRLGRDEALAALRAVTAAPSMTTVVEPGLADARHPRDRHEPRAATDSSGRAVPASAAYLPPPPSRDEASAR